MDYYNKTDEELLHESLKNEEAFAELFERYRDKLLLYIKRMCNYNEEIATEILHDTFLKVWKNINGFDESMKFSSWVYRIAHNESYNVWKREKKHSDNSYTGELSIEQVADKQDPVIDNIISKYQDTLIQDALNKLPIKYKEILILRFWENKEYNEISEILKKPTNTVGTLIRRAKNKLKEIIEAKP